MGLENLDKNTKNIKIVLTNGTEVTIDLSPENIKNFRFLNFKCTSCGNSTTLAGGSCGSCGHPFDKTEISSLTKLDKIDLSNSQPELDKKRLIYLLTHLMWYCPTCTGINFNYKRGGNSKNINCSCCGASFLDSYSNGKYNGIIIKDSDTGQTQKETIEDFKRKLQLALGGDNNHSQKLPIIEKTPGIKLSHLIIGGVFGLGVISTVIHFLTKEKDLLIEVQEHNWTGVIHTQELKLFNGESFDPNKYSFKKDFSKTFLGKKEDPSTCELKPTGRKLEDKSDCKRTEEIDQKVNVTLSGGATGTGTKKVSYCVEYGKKDEMKEICERRDYYRYSYMDWTTGNDITLNGSGKTPSYPNFSPNYNTKETSRETIYKLSIRKNDGSYEELIVSQQDWLEINNGIKCQIKVSLISGITIDKILECINN